jgi:hypothetical protein
MHEIDGEWYCDNCCFYCNYHDEYEPYPEDSCYISDYGYVCESAIDSGDFYNCEHCGDWRRIDSGTIKTTDGKTYCCERCAKKDGYIKVKDGKWYPQDEVCYCERCCGYVHKDDYDFDEECCNDCVPTEVESENREREVV